MWNAGPALADIFEFKNITPFEVLYEVEFPQIYTFKCSGYLFLACLSEISDAERVLRMLITPLEKNDLAALKEGHVTLRRVLSRGLLWSVDLDFNGNTIKSILLDSGLDSVPEGFKPKSNALLVNRDFYGYDGDVNDYISSISFQKEAASFSQLLGAKRSNASLEDTVLIEYNAFDESQESVELLLRKDAREEYISAAEMDSLEFNPKF